MLNQQQKQQKLKITLGENNILFQRLPTKQQNLLPSKSCHCSAGQATYYYCLVLDRQSFDQNTDYFTSQK